MKVLGLVWDESTSNELVTSGIVGTYDEATKKFFKGTNVHMAYVFRRKDHASNPIVDAVYSTVYRFAVMCTL